MKKLISLSHNRDAYKAAVHTLKLKKLPANNKINDRVLLNFLTINKIMDLELKLLGESLIGSFIMGRSDWYLSV